MPIIEMHQITRTYQIGDSELRILKGIDLQVEQGEFIAIMGPSGSGKSTLMQIMGLLDRPSGGVYRLLGQDVSKLSDDEGAALRCETIGFIFQMFNLLPRTSALDNVVLPMIYAARPDRQHHGNALLQLVGLNNRTDHKPNQLSGGQQQRVAIARALANEPKILFADEPTGNLASDQAEEVLATLTELHRSGITIVMVTHEPDIAAYAERIIRLKDGVIVSDERNPKRTPTHSSHTFRFENKPRPVTEKTFSFWLTEVREYVSTSWRAVTANKVRSVLSVLGILIGVAAVIAMLALGKGAQKAIETRLSGLGSNLIMLSPEAPSSQGVRGDSSSYSRLTLDDVKVIQKSSPHIVRVEGNVSGNAQIAFQNQNSNTQITGATSLYAPMRNAHPYYGRFFTDREDATMERVALLGNTVVTQLFGNQNPVGQSIKINRISFEVIGVLPIKGSGGFRDQDNVVVIPLQTAMRRVLGKKYLNTIAIEAASGDQIPQVMQDVTQLMRRRHRLPDFKENDFNLRNMADIQAALAGTTQTFGALLGIVAAISLLVGGIGIMNIMLVSVSERTREIGLRKAVGAARKVILTQFLLEASMLSMLGGALGVTLGVSISWTLSTLAGWAAIVTPQAILLAFCFSVGVGILFGFWPARKASLLSPIEALRYE